MSTRPCRVIFKAVAASGLTLSAMAAILVMAGDPGADKIPDRERQSELRLMLQQKCSACHGPGLQGGVAPALTARTLSGKDERLLVKQLMGGRDGTAMPRWGFVISESEALWLVRVLRGSESPPGTVTTFLKE